MSPATPRVAICIATRGRPLGLRRLLVSLPAGIRDADADVDVVVVDNTAGGEEQLDAGGMQALVRRPVTVLREPRPGIPHARNRALAHAVGDADVLVFVDDDEEVTPGWLRAHLDGLATLRADVTVGPVVPIMPASAAAWVADGAFHGGPRLATGATMRTAPTGNTAVRAAVIARVKPWFDPLFARTGGSDSEYFARVAAAGHRIVWVDDAMVREHIPAERARLGWVLRRAYRVGAVESLIARSRSATGPWLVAMRVVKGTAHVVVGVLRVLVGAIAGRRAAIVGLTEMARGMGTLAGVAGFRPRQYR